MINIPGVDKSILVHGRAVGEQFPISVATARIFESECFNRDDWEKGILMVNIMTLIRNVVNSVPGTNTYQYVRPDIITNAIFEDMSAISKTVEDLFEDDLSVQFYLPDLRNLHKLLPHADIRVPSTSNQVLYARMEDEVTKDFIRQAKSNVYMNVGVSLPKMDKHVYLVSHYSHELLSRYEFPCLTLVESYTGKLKDSTQWATKMTNKPDVPFNKFTLQLFGDNNVLLKQKPIALRRLILALAQENNWTPITTMDKIKSDINKITEREYRTTLLQMTR